MPEQERIYRQQLHSDLQLTRLTVGETDLGISLPPGVWTLKLEQGLRDHLVWQRSLLQKYIALHPAFAASHQPLRLLPEAPPLARRMAAAAEIAGVGPMAAVAGALAASAGRWLAKYSAEMVVENGGDIYIASQQPRIIGVYAGEVSPFSGQLGVSLQPADMPCGVCTSSGTVGSSFSYGRADAALVIADNAALADAVATAAGNLVQAAADVESACRYALALPGVRAALILCGEAMAVAGNIQLTAI
jgi:uncharacterized protein